MISTAKRFASDPESPLPGISDAAWSHFLAAMEVQAIDAISDSGGLGSYDLRPRRLVELGYANRLRSKRTETGRRIYTCEFILPWTQARFLYDPIAQHTAFSKSILGYYRAIMDKTYKQPHGATLAGTLAVLHVGGRGAIQKWPKLFDNTQKRYELAKRAF